MAPVKYIQNLYPDKPELNRIQANVAEALRSVDGSITTRLEGIQGPQGERGAPGADGVTTTYISGSSGINGGWDSVTEYDVTSQINTPQPAFTISVGLRQMEALVINYWAWCSTAVWNFNAGVAESKVYVIKDTAANTRTAISAVWGLAAIGAITDTTAGSTGVVTFNVVGLAGNPVTNWHLVVRRKRHSFP